jgi:hypothetical protein
VSDKSIRGGNECEGGQDYFIPGAEPQQEADHLKGGGAGGCKEDVLDSVFLLQELVTTGGEIPVSRYLAKADRLPDVFQLVSK